MKLLGNINLISPVVYGTNRVHMDVATSICPLLLLAHCLDVALVGHYRPIAPRLIWICW